MVLVCANMEPAQPNGTALGSLRPRPRSAGGTAAGVAGSPPPAPPRLRARGDGSPPEGQERSCLCRSCRLISDRVTPFQRFVTLTQKSICSQLIDARKKKRVRLRGRQRGWERKKKKKKKRVHAVRDSEHVLAGSLVGFQRFTETGTGSDPVSDT